MTTRTRTGSAPTSMRISWTGRAPWASRISIGARSTRSGTTTAGGNLDATRPRRGGPVTQPGCWSMPPGPDQVSGGRYSAWRRSIPRRSGRADRGACIHTSPGSLVGTTEAGGVRDRRDRRPPVPVRCRCVTPDHRPWVDVDSPLRRWDHQRRVLARPGRPPDPPGRIAGGQEWARPPEDVPVAGPAVRGRKARAAVRADRPTPASAHPRRPAPIGHCFRTRPGSSTRG